MKLNNMKVYYKVTKDVTPWLFSHMYMLKQDISSQTVVSFFSYKIYIFLENRSEKQLAVMKYSQPLHKLWNLSPPRGM